MEQRSKNGTESHSNPEPFECDSEKKNSSSVDRLHQENRCDSHGHDGRRHSENSGADVAG